MSASKVAENKVVSIHYTLRSTDAEGEVIDSSEGDEPLVLLWGAGQIVPGLEEALEGHSEGDRLEVTVEPEDGYGSKSSGGARSVPRDAFPEDVELIAGMCFDVEDDSGDVDTFWVLGVEGDEVLIDVDHPLAGVTLHFAVEVIAVRDATAEEIAHGHAH